ncbi:zincin-like metallopeptidase domain-containing protein [Campylobacter lari]|nr:zincin-like metallopeptidase domain-containing protein [Campylobacter lari]
MKNKDFIQETADKIIESLKNGTAPWIKPWKGIDLTNNMPYNPITNKPYNGINSINLMLQNYNDPRWLTYKQAQSINAQVRKGEKSTLIQYWQFSEIVDKLDEEGNIITNEKGEVEQIEVKLENPKVFFAYVFNAEQIENMPKLEQKQEIDNFKTIKEAQKILNDSKAIIHHQGNRAFYNVANDTITLPMKENFLSEGAYYATALHELGHWSGHESRLNRDLNHPFGSKEYAKEELRAEIASFLFNGKIGLDYDPGQHLSYIDSWVKILEDKPHEIFKATSDATKIVDFIENLSLEKKQNLELQNTKEQNTQQNKELNLATKKTYLYVPFSEKELAKKAGAKWDKESKMWYAPKGTDLNKLHSWLNNKEETQKFSNVYDEFKIFLEKAGLDIQGQPIMDGKIHRVSVVGDKGREKSGAYVGFLNGHPAGFVQNYKTGIKENWKSVNSIESTKNKEIDLKNAIEHNKSLKEQREKELNQAYEKTALKLESEYNNAKWANSEHPYLKEKGFDKNFYLKQDKNGNLLIPLRDIEGKYWATQRIFANGDKMIGATRTSEEKEQGIEYPAKKQGNFFLLGAKNLDNVQEVFICEGFATSASIYEATKSPTIMGVDAGNLEIIVTNIKEKYPKMNITIAGDNDIKKELNGNKNVGKTTALGIQEKYPEVKVVLPNFTNEEAQKGLSDFNDLMKSRGLEEIKRQLKEQIAKQLIVEKATTKATSKDKSIKKEISTKKDIGLSI